MPRYLFLLSACLILLPALASAHQPYLVGDTRDITVSDPEISRAYYGELTGEPAVYRIHAADAFDLYVSVLTPALSGAKRDVSAAVLRAGETDRPLAVLDGANADWQPYFEPFGGDNYFQGPEYRARIPAGNYEIRVWSSNNDSKYVLAVGERETFGPSEIVRTLLTLPVLKRSYFGEPLWQAYLNRAGLVAGGAIAVVVALAVILFYAVRKLIRRKESRSGN